MISRNFGFKFLNFRPQKNPVNEFTNVTNPIRITGKHIEVHFNVSGIPAENASILVATAIKNKTVNVNSLEESFFSKDSLIKFIPRYKNIANTIHFA